MHACMHWFESSVGAGKDLSCLPDRSDVMTHDPWMFGLQSTHPTAGEYLTRFTFRPTAAKDGRRRINGHGESSAQPLGVRVFVADQFSIDFWFVQTAE